MASVMIRVARPRGIMRLGMGKSEKGWKGTKKDNKRKRLARGSTKVGFVVLNFNVGGFGFRGNNPGKWLRGHSRGEDLTGLRHSINELSAQRLNLVLELRILLL